MPYLNITLPRIKYPDEKFGHIKCSLGTNENILNLAFYTNCNVQLVVQTELVSYIAHWAKSTTL